MYTGQMAHTGFGAMFLTCVALVMGGVGFLAKRVSRG